MDKRLLKTKRAHEYLDMDRKTFNKLVRPYVNYVPIGDRGIRFDRLDLDQWIVNNKRDGLPVPNTGERLWEDRSHKVCKSALGTGRLTNKSSDTEFAKALAQATSPKLKGI